MRRRDRPPPPVCHPGAELGEAPATDASARLGPCYPVPWAELLQKVFSLDVLDCPQCGGRLEVIAFITEAWVAKRILDHLELPSTGPPVSRSPAPEETFAPGPEYDGADPPGTSDEATRRFGHGTALPWGRRRARADTLAERRSGVATSTER